MAIFSYAILRNSVDQSVANNTNTAITWDTEDAKVGVTHTSGGATVTLAGGLYLIIAIASFAPNGTGYRQIKITEGAGNDIAFMENSGQGSAVSQRLALTLLHVVPSAGATYEVVALQTSGGSLGVLGVNSSYFMVVQLVTQTTP
jgi:hypothetical protein